MNETYTTVDLINALTQGVQRLNAVDVDSKFLQDKLKEVIKSIDVKS
ncbi:MAG: hypothetical protein KBT03_00330 [Bacteroidales bacterium]|nr:hypothetical protein [Candidatus Scybalousia scybalohippi]